MVVALGTGLLGTLFISFAARSEVGPGTAFPVLVGIDAALALVIIALSVRLDDRFQGVSDRRR